MPSADRAVLARKPEIVAALCEAAGTENVIYDPAETLAYECDALTAYRCAPLAVVLPRSTKAVADVMKACSRFGVPVVPRGSGTSLAGGALPTADSVVIGVSRLNRVLETSFADRYIRVEAGMTNLSVSAAVEAEGFFYAPDPSSQLACAIAGNVAMNSGGAHCLKYGVTTNNLLGVTLVTMDGEILEIGGPWCDPAGYDLLGVICGSEGQFGIVTEAVLRILRKPEGARPILMGFDSSEVAGACVADIIKSGVLPVAMEFMDGPAIIACENFAKAGYPTDVEALLIVEVEGFVDRRSTTSSPASRQLRRGIRQGHARERVCDPVRSHLEGPQGGFRRNGPDGRLHVHGRHHSDFAIAFRAAADERDGR